MGLLNHNELLIVEGVGKTPGDTQSVESDPIVIDLLGKTGGFSLLDWSPNIPSLKAGGVWADSPISDGRALVAGVNTNVTEVLKIQLTGATCVAFTTQFAALQRLIQDAREYSDTFYQIEPVYLRWWASGAPGPQFALIFNVDMKVTYQDSVQFQAELILTIEREFGWRGIAPGHNPKEWTIKSRGGIYLDTKASLLAATDNLLTDTIENVTEFSTSTTFTNKNFIDIPAALIPGDLPALSMIVVTLNENSDFLSIARSTKPTSLAVRTGIVSTELQNNDFTAAIAFNLGADTTLVNDTGGGLYTPASVNRRRASVSFATLATDGYRINWGNDTANRPSVGVNTLRGRYAAFLRARQDGGAFGNILMHLEYGITTLAATLPATISVSPTVQNGVGNTTDWPVTYMGVVQFPPVNKSVQNADGKGLYATPYDDNEFQIRLHASRPIAAGVLYIADLLLIPIDEPSILINAATINTHAVIYDTTGYFSRGTTEGNALQTVNSAGVILNNGFVSLSGPDLYLEPQKNNRLYFWNYFANLTSHLISGIGDVYINIVPRWSGIRDI